LACWSEAAGFVILFNLKQEPMPPACPTTQIECNSTIITIVFIIIIISVNVIVIHITNHKMKFKQIKKLLEQAKQPFFCHFFQSSSL